MAATPPTDQAFLREVDEELRREQLMTFWRRWGRWIVVAVIVGLIGLAAGLWWRQHQAEQAGADGEKLAAAYKALAANKPDEAQKMLTALAGSSASGVRALARFTQADILLQKKDSKGAAAKFAEVANEESYAQAFRDLALLRQTATEYDSLKPQTVVDRLQGMAVKDSPWFGSAGEMVAIAYLRMGKRDAAGKLFGEIGQAEGVPASIRQRAVQMAGVLGVDAVNQSEEKNAR